MLGISLTRTIIELLVCAPYGTCLYIKIISTGHLIFGSSHEGEGIVILISWSNLARRRE